LRVLVTGAGGFVGQALLAALDGRAELCGTARRGKPDTLGQRIAWHSCDLLAESAAKALIERFRPEVVVHTAWHTRPGSYQQDERNAVWLAASERLLEAFVASGGRRFVGIGSCAEYLAGTGPCHETRSPLSDASAYSAAKGALFRRLEQAREAGQVETAHARLFYLYGQGEKPTRLVPGLIASLLSGQPAETGPGALRRDFMNIGDVGRALARLTCSGLTGPINIGSGVAVRIDEIATRLGALTGRMELLRIGALAARAGEPELVLADCARMTKELGYRPETPLDRGLEEAVAWWRSAFDGG